MVYFVNASARRLPYSEFHQIFGDGVKGNLQNEQD
jgi:hypothetical protein